jgi:hypothetical protein
MRKRGNWPQGRSFKEMLELAYQEWADFREGQKTPEERNIPQPPNLPVPESYLLDCFLEHKGWTYTEYENQPDDTMWASRTIYDLRTKYGLL